MRKMKMFLTSVILVTTLPVSAAIFETNATGCNFGEVGGCEAKDIGVNYIKLVDFTDGCISSDDNAIVNIEVEVSAANANRYDMGIFLATDGKQFEDTATNTNTVTQCVHEALFPVTTVDADTDLTSGVGPFYDLSDTTTTDTCGDGKGKTGAITRLLVAGDISDNSTTALEIPVKCEDISGNGFTDIAWLVSYNQNNNRGCTTIAQAVQNSPTGPKCKQGIFDTNSVGNPYPIGIPELTLTIVCSPDGVKAGETTTCTVDYANANNANTGPADFIEFHIDYDQAYGSVSELTIVTNPSNNDVASDVDGDYINWIINADTTNPDRSTLASIPKNTTGQFTFKYTVDARYDDLNERAIDFVATAFFNNSGTGVAQSLTASDTVYLPVTVSYVYPKKSGNSIDIDFSTASETANIGFDIYAVQGKKWTKLNSAIIPGSLDSFEPMDYHASVTIPDGMKVEKIGIAGIDPNGVEDRHGPFKIDEESGAKEIVSKVDWVKVRSELKENRRAKMTSREAVSRKRKSKDQSITLSLSENAVYRVTHDDLMEASVDFIGERVKNIAISFRGKGVARHIDGVGKGGKWTKDSWIEFVGTKPDAIDALYVDANRYQLTLNKKLAIDSDAIEPTTAKEIVVGKNNRYTYATSSNDPFYEGYMITRRQSDTAKYTSIFDMPIISTEGVSLVEVDAYAVTEGRHHMTITLNGSEIASTTAQDKGAWIIETEVDNTLFRKSGNELSFSLFGEADGADMVIYDKMIIDYDDGEAVASITPTIEIGEKVSKEELETKKGRRGTNYVMVAHPLFIGATLDRYVKQREGEGWRIKVVNVEDIYAAYDNGMATPVAIKAYLKDAIQRGVTHVQLVGAASYDYHNYLGLGSLSFIPSLYALTSEYIKYTPCDGCYVMGDDELPSVAIGRWPVRTLGDFENLINKTLAWRSSGQSTSYSALLVADAIDSSGYNFAKQLETVGLKMEDNGWNSVERIYLDEVIKSHNGNTNAGILEARASVKQSFSDGPSLLAYNGHAAASVWSFSRLIHQSDISSIANRGKTAIALPFACQSTFADSPYINTMAHQLLAAGENGAVAIYGAAVMSSYGDNGASMGMVLDGLMRGETLGEAVKNSKHSLGASYRDVIRNGNLLGDVTLEMK
ncbi:MAG: C25 family cysteine peptidase [Campylobacterota bacterium]|nr:C25 family cysteine peptidase [Campylobacterota bacterium]